MKPLIDIKNIYPLLQSNSFPFLEKTFDDIDEYAILARIQKGISEVITNNNILNDNFRELNKYVTDYFKNLDVQDEIDNKLQQMSETGELQEIITDYLKLKTPIIFTNVQEMKNSSNLIEGSYAKTLGYYSKNDGGNSYYKIREITNQDVIDNGSIIPLNSGNLIAELLIEKNSINIEQFGALGDGIKDDTISIVNASNYCKNNKVMLSSAGKIYKITEDLTLTNCHINFNWGKIISEQKHITLNASDHIWDYRGDNIIIIENMKFEDTNVITNSPALSLRYLEFLNWHETALTLNSVRDVSNIYYGNDRSDLNTISLQVNISDKIIDKIQGRGRIYRNSYKCAKCYNNKFSVMAFKSK